MAPWIIEHLPAHTHFVETCAGSAAVMALKPPVDCETVNDIYEEVVNFFRVIRDPVQSVELIDRVALTPYAQAEFRLAWDAQEHPLETPVDRAWAFFVRMQMAVVPGRSGWSYGVQAASAKKANKPGRWATMPNHLQIIAARFERVQVTQWPVEECLQRLDAPGVLHLVDPPYLQESRPKSFDVYAHDKFDHASFLTACSTTKACEIVVTHYPHEFYASGPWDLLGCYESHRNIPNGSGREIVTEALYRFRREQHPLVRAAAESRAPVAFEAA